MLCGFFHLQRLPVVNTFWRCIDSMGLNQGQSWIAGCQSNYDGQSVINYIFLGGKNRANYMKFTLTKKGGVRICFYENSKEQ